MDDDDDDIIIAAYVYKPLFSPKISAILAFVSFFPLLLPPDNYSWYWLVVNDVSKIRRRQNL